MRVLLLYRYLFIILKVERAYHLLFKWSYATVGTRFLNESLESLM